MFVRHFTRYACAVFILSAITCGPFQAQASEEPHLFAKDLDITSFNSSLAAVTTPWALVEFYASWCPACQHFMPEFEKVAKLFNDPSSPYSAFIHVARVDCASQGPLCVRFGVEYYPMMVWGTPAAIALGSDKDKKPSGEKGGGPPVLTLVDSERSAAGVVKWINGKTGREFTLDLPPASLMTNSSNDGHHVALAHKGPSGDAQWSKLAIHDVEEATAVAFAFVFNSLRLKHEMRPPLLKFVRTLSRAHPSPRCRHGLASLSHNFNDWWPSDQNQEEDPAVNVTAFNEIAVCGAGIPSKSWVQCKGSKPKTRGYSCGLWLLFHSLSVGVDPQQGPAAVASMADFVRFFFGCSQCKDHFFEMAKDLGIESVKTREEGILWIWKAHNTVNKRLAAEEAASDGKRGDPAFPKHQWPSRAQCPKCRKNVEGGAEDDGWVEEEVVRFLEGYYQKQEGEAEPQTEEGKGGTTTRRHGSFGRSSDSSSSFSLGGSLNWILVLLFAAAASAAGLMAWRSLLRGQHQRQSRRRKPIRKRFGYHLV